MRQVKGCSPVCNFLHIFGNDIVKMLYSALFRSNSEFACPIWSPYNKTQRETTESVQKNFIMHINGDFQRWRDGDFVLTPYRTRCDDHEMTTLIRRRVNASVLFIYAVISGKYNAPNLRALMNLNTGIRTFRKPEFIRIKSARLECSTFSSFNNACRMFNHAALFIDHIATLRL